MIISRTPFRISFAGGGSDFQDYYSERYGKVVSAAINKFVYVMVNRRFDNQIRVGYSQNEMVDRVDLVQHDIVREALRITGINQGVEVVYISDVSLRNTGLGGSSSLAVGVLNALHAFRGESVTAEDLAREACRIEIEILGRPIGKQDQYAAAYGGLNSIQFDPDEGVRVTPLGLSGSARQMLDQNLLLFYTGLESGSSAILAEQKQMIGQNRGVLDRMVGLAEDLEKKFWAGNLSQFGTLLHNGWLEKQKLASGITNPTLQFHYERSLGAGAEGGKILGSGGGGFLLLYVESKHQEILRTALADLPEIPFSLEASGSQILAS